MIFYKQIYFKDFKISKKFKQENFVNKNKEFRDKVKK